MIGTMGPFSLFCGTVTVVLVSFGSFSTGQEASYGAHVPPGLIGHAGGQGWGPGSGSGNAAGSYYHYHVPLVGQQQPAAPAYYPPSQSKGEILLWLLPLILVGIGPALFLPFLLKLFLVPVGLGLLGILLPLLMMGGMMMMMMMMSGGGGMMMMMRNPGTAVSTARVLGQLLFTNNNDWSALPQILGRSIDVDKCPQRLACEVGRLYFSSNNSSTATDWTTKEGSLDSFLNLLPKKGGVRGLLKWSKAAFVHGGKSGSCEAFRCSPGIKSAEDPKSSNSTGESQRSESFQGEGLTKRTNTQATVASSSKSTQIPTALYGQHPTSQHSS